MKNVAFTSSEHANQQFFDVNLSGRFFAVANVFSIDDHQKIMVFTEATIPYCLYWYSEFQKGLCCKSTTTYEWYTSAHCTAFPTLSSSSAATAADSKTNYYLAILTIIPNFSQSLGYLNPIENHWSCCV